MNSTIRFYDENADTFIANTIDVNMSDIYKEFLCCIPKGGRILDAGCGSGRDSKFFLEHGYQVEAFDASEAMCRAAKDYTGLEVVQATFKDYSSELLFDGIWACASLLHVRRNDLINVLCHFMEMLTLEGIMYCSWKYGETEHNQENGKYYCDMDEVLIEKLIRQIDLQIINMWKTSDMRANCSNIWLNVLFEKKDRLMEKQNTDTFS